MFKSDKNRFYMENDANQLIAEITFRHANPSILIIDHTFVDESLRGQGVGRQLVAQVVELARKENKKIIPLCPYAKKEFIHNESYHDVWQNKQS